MISRPLLNSKELVEHLKSEGVKFTITTEDEAEIYLTKDNTFFNLNSYKKNFSKYTDGKNAGKYENLEFAYLVELNMLDMEVRHILLKMCLDIELFLKVYLISFVRKRASLGTGEDGYKIVRDYLGDVYNENKREKAANSRGRRSTYNKKINQSEKNPYCIDLVYKYGNKLPIWAYVEIIDFGDLLDIIDFCMKYYSMTLPLDRLCLDRVRKIRNATSHNNCIINDLCKYEEKIKTPSYITIFASNAQISKNIRRKKLNNMRINQMTHLFYAYDKIVECNSSRRARVDELKDLMYNRMLVHSDYFKDNAVISSTYDYFRKIVDFI